jgi:proline iminopeptidase
METSFYTSKSQHLIFLLILLIILLESSKDVSAQNIMSPMPPPPAFSSSLSPQPAPLPPAPSGLSLKQGYLQGKDGVQLFYRVVGSGKDTIVFLHGGPGMSMEDGALDFEMLAKKGYTFIGYDQRGGGRSELVRDTTKLTMDDQVEDLEALRQQFHIQKLTLIGLSWGAAIIAYYTSRFPQQVSRLVFLSPMPTTTEYATKRWIAVDSALGKDKKKRLDELDSLMSGSVSDSDYRALTIKYGSTFQPAYVTDSAHIARARGSRATLSPMALRNSSVHSVQRYLGNPWDFRSLLTNIKVPVLVMEGEKTNVPLDATREYVYNIKGSKLILIPDAGHQFWLDQPEAALNALDHFFKSTGRYTR